MPLITKTTQPLFSSCHPNVVIDLDSVNICLTLHWINFQQLFFLSKSLCCYLSGAIKYKIDIKQGEM